MAGASARYRRAYQSGTAGHQLPTGLADMADDDPKIDSAYQAGQGNDQSFEQWLDENPGAKGTPSRSGSKGRSRSGPGRRRKSSGRSDAAKGFARSPGGAITAPATQIVGSSTEEGAGFILGMVVYALVLSVVDYGIGGPAMWFNAKFRNKVTAPRKAGTTV
jgi:hypothetical protein